MILSDGDIRRRLRSGDLVVEPEVDYDIQIQPASLDLRLGNKFIEFRDANVGAIDLKKGVNKSEYLREVEVGKGADGDNQLKLDDFGDVPETESRNGDDEYVLHPGNFVLGTTLERVEIPDDLIAHVEGRSSLGRLAIVVHATAGIVDPGYEGQITLELSNLGKVPVKLTPGMRISQLTFTELKNRAELPYGEERGSKYQGQTGPQASRIEGDVEFAGER